MLQAMLAGVASIKAHQSRLNVIGNNLANVNTTAFKGSRMGFQELLAQTLRSASAPNASIGGVNPVQVGLGTRIASADVIHDQGSLQATNRQTDFALQGQGFFIVSDGSEIGYTRDGAFDIDANGTIVFRGQGYKLLGWAADSDGNINTQGQLSALSDVRIPIGILTSVQQTTKAPFAGNLDSRSDATATRVVTTTVYDSLGGAHEITVTFSNHQVGSFVGGAATGSWDWTAREGNTVVGSSSTAGNSALYFDSSGKAVPNIPPGVQSISITPINGATPFSVTLELGELQQVEAMTNVQAGPANGFKPGTLSSFTVGLDGVVTGTFTNGYSRPIARLALAVFANPGGLEKIGDNLMRQSNNSGLPAIGAPTENGRAEVNVGFLEQSNVDISDQFTTLITTQRGFQANTKVVTTIDEMMQDVLNMKR